MFAAVFKARTGPSVAGRIVVPAVAGRNGPRCAEQAECARQRRQSAWRPRDGAARRARARARSPCAAGRRARGRARAASPAVTAKRRSSSATAASSSSWPSVPERGRDVLAGDAERRQAALDPLGAPGVEAAAVLGEAVGEARVVDIAALRSSPSTSSASCQARRAPSGTGAAASSASVRSRCIERAPGDVERLAAPRSLALGVHAATPTSAADRRPGPRRSRSAPRGPD